MNDAQLDTIAHLVVDGKVTEHVLADHQQGFWTLAAVIKELEARIVILEQAVSDLQATTVRRGVPLYRPTSAQLPSE